MPVSALWQSFYVYGRSVEEIGGPNWWPHLSAEQIRFAIGWYDRAYGQRTKLRRAATP